MTATDQATAQRLVEAARDLFARRGYDGTSIRAITSRARANLGAVTYHFGTKERLYAAVVASVAGPLGSRVREAASGNGSALERIAAVIEAYFDHFAHAPDMPKLVVQQVFTGRPLPAPLREAMAGILNTVAGLIREGQAAGQIRSGDPILMTLSILSQPIYFNIVRGPLKQAGLLDLTDRVAQRAVVDHASRFAQQGLAAHPEGSP